jgi:uncharacterized damage-inducible protein DinB
MPKTGFYDLSRHHGWATETLLTFCESQDAATLDTPVPGTYGPILDTLRHLVDSDASYIRRITNVWPDHPWKDDFEVDLATLRERSRILGDVLIEFLDGEWDVDAIQEAYGPDDTVFEIPAGVFVTQIFHHANEHRAHVCSAFGALGIEPPDVSAWEYSVASERARLIVEPSSSE